MKHVIAPTLLALSLLLPTVSQADEVWNTNTGQFVYQADIGPTAVWRYGNAQDPGVVYLLGLAKVYKGRTKYDGYWAKTKAKQACESQRPGIDGVMTNYWGRFQVRFLDADFPSRWEAVWSYCDGEAEKVNIKAEPVLAK